MRVKVFFCYAHEDELLLKKLKIQLTSMQRQGLVEMWHDRDINAGTEWEQEISGRLNAAQIILLLVSPDFMASDYCYSKEMQRALERHHREEAYVIPIILRPVHWKDVLGSIQALPTNGKPVISWHSPDEAFFNIADGIRKVVEEIAKHPLSQMFQSSEQSKRVLSKHTIQQGINGQDQSSDLQASKNQFNDAMVNLYKEAAKIGYHANQFFHMVNENGGVETAHLLLAKGQYVKYCVKLPSLVELQM
jgi:TIR domain